MVDALSIDPSRPPLLDTVRISRRLLNQLSSKRQREVLCARLGLFGQKLTFRAIAERCGTSHQDVAALESLARKNLRAQAVGGEPQFIQSARTVVAAAVERAGNTVPVNELCHVLGLSIAEEEAARLLFIVNYCPRLTVIPDGRKYRASVTMHPVAVVDTARARLIEVLAADQEPRTMLLIAAELGEREVQDLGAIASICKDLAEYDGLWGLTTSGEVNPRSIHDKAYLVLQAAGKPLHFSDVAKGLRFPHLNVESVHQEMIRDDRMVRVGQGVYALREWGYEARTIVEAIADVVKAAEGPLSRQEIVDRVTQRYPFKPQSVRGLVSSVSSVVRIGPHQYVWRQ